jgi:pyrroline-5-carboxylate reductase
MKELNKFLGSSSIVGIFGAGHLGRTIAQGLLNAGLGRHQLAVCHRGSAETSELLRKEGLADVVVTPDELCLRSKILLYIVRPRDYLAIGNYTLRDDCLLLSFLGGVSLAQLPISLPDDQRIRIMPGAPDTMRKGKGIAGVYPSDNPYAKEILAALELREVPLHQESDIHAFTGLGLCLPIALTCWDGLGHDFDESKYVETAQKYALPDPSGMVKWARAVQLRNLSVKQREHYLNQAATPGGVTEAVLRGIEQGEPITTALERGVQRSRELASL